MKEVRRNRWRRPRYEFVGIRFSPKELNDMHDLLEKGLYDNRSQLVRVAVKRLIQWHKERGDI